MKFHFTPSINVIPYDEHCENCNCLVNQTNEFVYCENCRYCYCQLCRSNYSCYKCEFRYCDNCIIDCDMCLRPICNCYLPDLHRYTCVTCRTCVMPNGNICSVCTEQQSKSYSRCTACNQLICFNCQSYKLKSTKNSKTELCLDCWTTIAHISKKIDRNNPKIYDVNIWKIIGELANT